MSRNLQNNLQNENFSLKFFIPVFIIIAYWFYISLSFGYFFSKFCYKTFDKIHKTDISKIIQFRKKFSFENLIKIIIKNFRKRIINWLLRIWDKFCQFIGSIIKVFKALILYIRKFNSKYNFRLLKLFLAICLQTFLVAGSFGAELWFIHNIINWIREWMDIIRLLMEDSVLILRIMYILYFFLLGAFGFLLGFLLGLWYNHEEEINLFLLLLLLQILYTYNTGFNDILFEILGRRFLEPGNIEQFSKFPLQVFEPLNPMSLRPSKLFLGELVEKPQIPLPFPIIEDPLFLIDTKILWDESLNYKFELFKFYRYVNQKI